MKYNIHEDPIVSIAPPFFPDLPVKDISWTLQQIPGSGTVVEDE